MKSNCTSLHWLCDAILSDSYFQNLIFIGLFLSKSIGAQVRFGPFFFNSTSEYSDSLMHGVLCYQYYTSIFFCTYDYFRRSLCCHGSSQVLQVDLGEISLSQSSHQGVPDPGVR